MTRFLATILATAALVVLSVTVASQPPDGKDQPEKKKKKDGFGGPKKFELGRVLPPPLVEELELTKEQEQAIATLEKEVKARLEKILTAAQKQKAANFRPKGPPGGGPDGPDGPPKKDKGSKDGKGKDGKDPKEPPKDEARNATPTAGIQWFATLESGTREARRTGRPILLVSAAPHCAGVSGMW